MISTHVKGTKKEKKRERKQFTHLFRNFFLNLKIKPGTQGMVVDRCRDAKTTGIPSLRTKIKVILHS